MKKNHYDNNTNIRIIGVNLRLIFIVLCLGIGTWFIPSYGAELNSTAQLNQNEPLMNPVISEIVTSYQPWHSVEFNGKLKYDILPVSPTLKIFMVSDSLLQISARVPLLGEVGRVSLSKTEITLVNKLKRNYCQEPAQNLLELYPELLSDLQGLLLARIVILGAGQLSSNNPENISVENDGEGGWMLIPPTSNDGLVSLNYGYLVGPSYRTMAFLANIPEKGSLQILYSYANRGMKMNIGLDRVKSQTDIELDFNSVKWGGTEMAPLKLNNYNRVGIKDFIKSLSK